MTEPNHISEDNTDELPDNQRIKQWRKTFQLFEQSLRLFREIRIPIVQQS